MFIVFTKCLLLITLQIKVAKKELLDGVFQVDIGNRQFSFIVKAEVIHCIPFSSLYPILFISFCNSYATSETTPRI